MHTINKLSWVDCICYQCIFVAKIIFSLGASQYKYRLGPLDWAVLKRSNFYWSMVFKQRKAKRNRMNRYQWSWKIDTCNVVILQNDDEFLHRGPGCWYHVLPTPWFNLLIAAFGWFFKPFSGFASAEILYSFQWDFHYLGNFPMLTTSPLGNIFGNSDES